MIDAYRIGVKIALQGGLGTIITQLVEQFSRLDAAVKSGTGALQGMAASMRAVAAEGNAAAAAWQKAATAMRAAAQAGTAAAGAAAGLRVGAGAGAAAGAASAAAVSASAAAAATQSPSYGSGGGAMVVRPNYLPVPYQNPATGFSLEGTPYTPPYGSATPRPYVGPGRELIPYVGPGRGLIPYGSPQTGLTPGESGSLGTGFTLGPGGYGGGGPGTGFTFGPGGYGGGGPWRGRPPAGQGGIPLGPVPPGYNLPNGPDGYVYTPGKGPEISAFKLGVPAFLGGEWMRENWEKAAEVDAIRAMLMKQGFSAQEATGAYGEAFDVQRKVLGTSVPGNLKLISDLMTVTQDKGLATDPRLVEEYAKLGVVLNGSGHGNEIGGLMSAIRSTEFRGIMMHKGAGGQEELDIPEISRFLHLITAMNVVSGGSIGPSQLLQYLRASGTSGAMISDESLVKQMSLMIAMNTSRAGRGLQGFEQQFTAGRMSEAAAHLLLDMHILNGPDDPRHNPFLRKNGIGQFMLLPGALPPGVMEEAATHPDLFIMDQVLPKMKEYLHKNYGDAYDRGDDKTKKLYETALATQIASRIPGGVSMAETIRNMFLMDRDAAAAARQLQGPDAYKTSVENDPTLRAKSLGAAYGALQTTLGNSTMEPAARILTGLTGGLNDLSAWTTAHGDITAIGMKSLAAAIALLGGAAVVAGIAAMGPVAGTLIAIGGGATAATLGLQKLEGWLQSIGLVTSDAEAAKRKADWDKNGITIPWWAPLPPGGQVHKEPLPPWLQWLNPANDPHATAGGTQQHSYAPPSGTGIGAGALGPVPVVVTNGRDLTQGVANGIASQLNKPPSGVTGVDPTMDPGYSYLGWVP